MKKWEKILSKVLSKHDEIILKLRHKKNFIFFDNEVYNKKLIEKHSYNKTNDNIFLDFNEKKSIFSDLKFKKWDDILYWWNFKSVIVDDADNRFDSNLVSVNVWSPNTFNTFSSVNEVSSDGNNLVLSHYRHKLQQLKNEMPDYDWDSLFNDFRFDLGQVMRHLIMTIKLADGKIIMVHFTTSDNSIIKWTLSENGILVPIIFDKNSIIEGDSQLITNPTIISQDFYNKFFESGDFMVNTTENMNSELNEKILLRLGFENNEDLGNFIFEFIKLIENLRVMRGVNLYSDINVVNILDDFYKNHCVNSDLSSALDAIFFLFTSEDG